MKAPRYHFVSEFPIEHRRMIDHVHAGRNRGPSGGQTLAVTARPDAKGVRLRDRNCDLLVSQVAQDRLPPGGSRGVTKYQLDEISACSPFLAHDGSNLLDAVGKVVAPSLRSRIASRVGSCNERTRAIDNTTLNHPLQRVDTSVLTAWVSNRRDTHFDRTLRREDPLHSSFRNQLIGDFPCGATDQMEMAVY
jgi:hypothetical protein